MERDREAKTRQSEEPEYCVAHWREEQASQKGVAPGWWITDRIETPIHGPYPSREACLVAMAKFGETASGG